MSEKKSREELMAIAKQPLKVPIRKKVSGAAIDHSVEPVRKFIDEFNLNASNKQPVPVSIIYTKYSDWCRNNYETAIAYLTFFKKFKLFFNMIKIGGETHYLINPEPFDLSEQNKQYVKEIQQKGRKAR